MRWRGGLLALAFLVGACGGGDPYFDVDEERAGIAFDWGPMEQRSGVEELVASCESSLGFSFSDGAWVKFVPDANRDCHISEKQMRIAGCWLVEMDLVVLEPANDLGDTALCHELLHRELFVRDRDPDYQHVGSSWSSLRAEEP